jgi:hypothetical protein
MYDQFLPMIIIIKISEVPNFCFVIYKNRAKIAQI